MIADDEPPLRFGHLEAFVAAADSCDYKDAGLKLGLHPVNAQRNVEQLERWLRCILISDNNPLRLSDPWGLSFLPIATDAINILNKDLRLKSNFSDSLRQARSISFIELGDLNALLAIGQWGNYDEAAFRLGISASRLRRRIKSLEFVLGMPLIVGRSTIRIASEAEEFAASAARVLSSIRNFRQSLPPGYNTTDQAALVIYRSADSERKSIAASISIIEKRKRLSKSTRRTLIDARLRISFLDKVCSSLLIKLSQSTTNP